MDSGQSPLDPDTVQSLRELQSPGGPNLLEELSVAFHDDAQARLAELRDALASDDRAKVRSIAHSLKGMCEAIGAQQMAALSVELERSAMAASVDAQLASRLDLEFARVTAALRALS